MIYDRDMLVEREGRKLKGGRIIRTKYNWPFKNMIVGQRVMFKDKEIIRIVRQYVHPFAAKRNWKFKTWMQNNLLVVMRDVNQ
jgi:hypothetical protein